MHSGPIRLPEPLQERCVALVNLASMIGLFNISTFVHVMAVHSRIVTGRASILDLQDVIRLCNIVSANERVNVLLRQDIEQFRDIVILFLDAACAPTRSCAMWSCVGQQ